MEIRHVVIVGGGFGGVACAQQLARNHEVRVTLVDQHNYHQFQPLFYQVAASQLAAEDVAFSLSTIFRESPNVDIKLAEVNAIDPKARSVSTKEGQVYQGDFLVLAAGAQANFLDIPGAETNSFPLYSLVDAERLRSRLLALFEDCDREPDLLEQGGLNVVVVGGGATGTEVAGALADMIHSVAPTKYERLINATHIYLVEHGPTLLAPFSAKAHDYASKVLQRGGVILKLNTDVKEVHSGHVLLSDGNTLKSRCVIWGAGLKAATIASNLGLPRGRGGRIDVENDLSVKGFPGVYAVGDFANVVGEDGKALPQLGSVAQQTGRWVGKNILADIGGTPRAPFHYHDKGIMAMIGRNAAIAEVGEHRHELEGVPAYSMWLGVHMALLSGLRVKVETFVDWVWNYFSKGGGSMLLDRSDAARINWHDDDADTRAPDAKLAPLRKDTAGR
ncbi:MAG TPA: NAD(P)/FAD-dependent oxidoreductase [Candidatus Sulfotelmatobacter sp.]|nr:NAD(P)/FAD-dependent oxidoreductase [Candidatus Sulfotelmatobacter sp.]